MDRTSRIIIVCLLIGVFCLAGLFFTRDSNAGLNVAGRYVPTIYFSKDHFQVKAICITDTASGDTVCDETPTPTCHPKSKEKPAKCKDRKIKFRNPHKAL